SVLLRVRVAPINDPPARNAALDGVRGLAISSVVFWHYFTNRLADRPALMTSTPGIFLEGILGLGWAGVDLFFVLSGFLIGSILLRNHRAQNYYVTFYARRAYRILPLYVLVL